MPKLNKLVSKRHLRRIVAKNVVDVKKKLENKQLPVPFISSNKSLPTISDNLTFNGISKSPINSNNQQTNECIRHTSDYFYFSNEFTIQCSNEQQTYPDNELSERNDRLSNELVFLEKFKTWAYNNNVTHKCINELIEIIGPTFPFLKKDARTLLGTPRSVVTYSLKNGEIIYLGLERGLLKKIENGFNSNQNGRLIALQVNIDGIPLFNNGGSGEFWPILVRSVSLKDNSPFAVAIFFGNGKPDSLDEYLKNFIDECSLLLQNGIKHSGNLYNIKLSFFSCDAPARAYLKQVMGHTSKAGCERCIIKSNYQDGKRFYPVNILADARKDNDFEGNIEGNSYIKQKSPLLKLNVKLISQFVLDPMHLIFLGVMKRLIIHYWVEGKRPYKLSRNVLDNINNQIKNMKKFIGYFPRKMRSFSFIKKWKATEYRFFLLYCGCVLLKNKVNNEIYKHFLLFHSAIFILSNTFLLSHYFEIANAALYKFVNLCPSIYGDSIVVYNIHSLIHVCDDVRLYGCLDDYGCFPFENYLGKLKNHVRGKYLPLQQINNRLSEIDNVYKNIPDIEPAIESTPAFGSNRTANYCEYRKLKINNMIISTDTKDNIIARCNTIYKIKSILYMDNTYKCIACPFKYLEDFYDDPIQSSKLGIYYGRGEKERTIFNVSEITGKYFSNPFKDGYVLVPILHTYKK